MRASDLIFLRKNVPQRIRHSVESEPQEPRASLSRRLVLPSVTPPKLATYLREVDAGNGSSTRAKAYVSDIGEKRCTIHIDTWVDMKLYSVLASWVAQPEDKDYIGYRPQADNITVINFRSPSFKNPHVFVALNSIDISTATNARVKAYVNNVSTGGLTRHIDSWSDTKLSSAGITYIALN